jgi:hypothetical protein
MGLRSVAELDLNPVLALPRGCVAVGAPGTDLACSGKRARDDLVAGRAWR